MTALFTPGPWRPSYTQIADVVAENGALIAKCNRLGTLVVLQANSRLIAAAPDLLTDLREAAVTLRRYEALHRAKGAPESDAKAEVNAALATRFEATIARATGAAS